MVDLRTTKSRDEIEQELRDKGYTLDFEDRDDQIWIKDNETEILFISWINAELWSYLQTRKPDIESFAQELKSQEVEPEFKDKKRRIWISSPKQEEMLYEYRVDKFKYYKRTRKIDL